MPGTTTRNLSTLLLLATRAVSREAQLRLAAAGYADLRPAQEYSLQFLATSGGAAGAELARHLGTTKQAAAQQLDYLEARGYLIRSPAERDGRARIAYLTDRGWACVRAAAAVWQEIERDAVNLIGADALTATRHALDHLATEPLGHPGRTPETHD